MAKRKLLQWMRERLETHAGTVVAPAAEKKALEASYKKAAPRVIAVVQKKFPTKDMEVLAKWKCSSKFGDVRLQYPNGSVVEFKLNEDDIQQRPEDYSFRHQMFLVDEVTAKAVDTWLTAKECYETERHKRLTAYKALIAGASTVEDVIDAWPEAKDVLPAGSPLIPLGPEQIATIKADQRERKAA